MFHSELLASQVEAAGKQTVCGKYTLRLPRSGLQEVSSFGVRELDKVRVKTGK